MFGILIDHAFTKIKLMEEFFFNATVQNIYFSGLDSLRIIIKKNFVDFCTIP